MVTEHRIRLRGGWEARAAGAPEGQVWRLSLPVYWREDWPRRAVLTRRFGRPPLDECRQVLLLQMDQVEGIRSVSLNGRTVAPVRLGACRFELEIPSPAERNILALEIELPAQTADSGYSFEWGVISLVVRTIEPAP